VEQFEMKTVAKIWSRSHRERFAVPRNPNLVAQWPRGFETISKQYTLSHPASAARNSRYPTAKDARRFAIFAAKAIAIFAKF
jgi:hypothetical protein